MVKVNCPICNVMGFLEQRGNSYRVKHYVGRVIEDWEKAGWHLHIYACAGNANITFGTNHYLLFEKGE
jgi:hypothetical protein